MYSDAGAEGGHYWCGMWSLYTLLGRIYSYHHLLSRRRMCWDWENVWVEFGTVKSFLVPGHPL